MVTQRFDGAQFLAAASSPFVREGPMACCAAPIVNAERIGAIGERADPGQLYGTKVDLRLLAKGVGWGLGIESLAAISLYGIWRLWHLWMF